MIVIGRADPAERVRALERCDDYLSRPFLYEELVARIHAVLRRRPPRDERIEVGGLVVDRAARRVAARGREVVLATKEYSLLVKLASEPDRVFTREQLLRDVWGYRTYVATRTLESHASRVRRKLEDAGIDGWVVNVWGVGYKLRPVRRPPRDGAGWPTVRRPRDHRGMNLLAMTKHTGIRLAEVGEGLGALGGLALLSRRHDAVRPPRRDDLRRPRPRRRLRLLIVATRWGHFG